MALAPVDYGPQVSADTEGLQSMQRAVAQHEQVFAEARQLGAVVEGGSRMVVQGILHGQATKATAAVKERQAATLQFIESNPEVPKAVLQQRMTPEDYAAWDASTGSRPEYKDKLKVPMFTAAGALFDSEAGQARKQAGEIITLPGWRTGWEATERTESATIRERYVNRMAADQMIADQRGQALLNIDKVADAAVRPEDLDSAAKMAETSPWLKPAERRLTVERLMVQRDSFTARNAQLAGDTDVMKAELDKLRGPDAATAYPNMNVKQRLDLEHQLLREYGFKMSKDVADKMVSAHISDTGKPDTTAINKDLIAYKGLNAADVVKFVRAEVAERINLFHSQMADLQQVVYKAGQNPMTAEFSYAKAMRDPAARKAAAQLNADASGMLTSLAKEDQRNVNIEARATALEAREERARAITSSAAKLDDVHRELDDPAGAAAWRDKTAAQWDSHILDLGLFGQDKDRARRAFVDFQKNGGKPDERPQAAVKKELMAAANDDAATYKKLDSKYGSTLLEAAHRFLRTADPTMRPDALTDAMRAEVRGKLLSGTVKDSGLVFDTATKRVDWEYNPRPEFAGHAFVLKDGTVVPASAQQVHLTTKDGKISGWFSVDDAKAALADTEVRWERK